MDKVSPERRIRILIADDHPIFREGLRRLLESDGSFEVVGEGQDGGEAVQLAQKLQPDILLLDVSMPRVTGLTALEELSRANHAVRTILLTASIGQSDIVTALQLGARGVVLKDAATRLLFKAIRCVVDGQYWVDRESVSDLVQSLRSLMATAQEQTRKKTFGLTKRELEIVGAIVAGNSNKDIAQKFTISEDTVKHHLTNVFNKVGVSNRLELALFAVHHKLVDEF
jgi:DNA-binding NarL/FixJ family response regulator